jgi:hypothetical protein
MVPHHIGSPPSATISFSEMMLVLLKNLIVVNFFVVSFHPETPPCHSEPFDRLRTGSAKNLCGPSKYEILRRPAPAGLLRMTPINAVSGWALVIDSISRCAEPYFLPSFEFAR